MKPHSKLTIIYYIIIRCANFQTGSNMIGWLNFGLKMTIPYHNNYYVTLVECFSSITADSGVVSTYIHSSTLLVFSTFHWLV